MAKLDLIRKLLLVVHAYVYIFEYNWGSRKAHQIKKDNDEVTQSSM